MALFVVLSAGVGALAAAYIAGALFLVLNKVHPRQAQLLSIVTYWQHYAGDPVLRKKLLVSIGVPCLALGVLLPSAFVAALRQRRPLHGDARFATRREIVKAGLMGSNRSGTPGILVGRYGRRFLSLHGQLSVMLSAPTRSGKGVGVVIPNLLNWPDSVVVLDIKGENFDVTAGYRARHGQEVYAFSPFDEAARSHRWNPLGTVRNNALHRVSDLLAIGQVFFPNEGTATSSEAFFNDQARNLFLGIGLYLLETPDLPRTIGEMLRQSSGKGQPIKDHFAAAIRERQESGMPLTDECTSALQRLLSNSDNTLSSIVATFNAPLVVFADTVVDAATSASDFKLEDVRSRRMSIYVRVPPNRLASARPLLSLFFSQLVNLNTRTLPPRERDSRLQCLLANDEFTAMGRVNLISSAAAFLAGYDLRLLTVVQAMSQLDAVYGDKEARTFATNHGLQILFAPREQRDAEEYSAMLGHFTERATSRGRSRSFSGRGQTTISRNESDQRRSLLLPQEFKELGAERLVLVFENCKPILGEKIRYHRERVFTDRVLPPPSVPALDIDLHFARVEQRRSDAPDDLPSDQALSIDQLALSAQALPDFGAVETGSALVDRVDAFFALTRVAPATPSPGGTVEPIAPSQSQGHSVETEVI